MGMNDKRTIIGLFLSVFLMMIGVGMIVAVMPQRYIALSGSPSTVGSLAAAFALTYLLVQFGVGRLADRYGFKPFLIAGYYVCAAAGICFYFGQDALALIAGRLVQGVGEAPVWSLAPAALALQNPSRPGRLIGGYNAVLHLGLAIGPAAGLLIGRWLPEETTFGVYSILCFSGGSILFGTLSKEVNIRVQTTRRLSMAGILAQLVANRKLLATLFGAGLYGAGYGAFLTVIPVFLQLVKGYDLLGIGIFFSGFYIAIGMAALLTGHLTDRYGQPRIMIAGMLVAGIAIFVAPALDEGVLASLLILSVLALGSFGVSSLAYLNEMAPIGLKGSYSGIYFLCWGLGMFCGPLILGGIDAWTAAGVGLRIFGALMTLYVFNLWRAVFRRGVTGKTGRD
jgi:MFS family permease